MPRNAEKQNRKWRRGLEPLLGFMRHDGLFAAFLLLISIPLLDMAFKVSRPVFFRENRKPAPLPRFELQRPLAFFKQYEAYFNDHFGMRTQLLRAHSRLVFRVLRTSPSPKVIVGRQGWLYLAYEGDFDNEVDYYRNVRPFTPGELEAFKNILEERRDWLARRGIRYLFMVAPNKSTIYPEFMPAAINKVHPRSRLDQLVEYLSRHSSLRLLDLRPALLREKRTRRIYYKTDSHWNDLGGYFAYREMITRLGEHFPQLKPLPLDGFTVGQASAPGGDLAVMLSMQRDRFREMRVIVTPKVPFRSRPAAPTAGFRPKVRWVRLQASQSPGGQVPVAVMVRDSFAQQLHPYLSEHFQRIVYIWDWGMHFFTPVIEKEKPWIVIDEMAERSLLNPTPVNPDELKRPPAPLPAQLNPR
jgi:alginate O-acetyltransferase complex protein AlgJ